MRYLFALSGTRLGTKDALALPFRSLGNPFGNERRPCVTFSLSREPVWERKTPLRYLFALSGAHTLRYLFALSGTRLGTKDALALPFRSLENPFGNERRPCVTFRLSWEPVRSLEDPLRYLFALSGTRLGAKDALALPFSLSREPVWERKTLLRYLFALSGTRLGTKDALALPFRSLENPLGHERRPCVTFSLSREPVRSRKTLLRYLSALLGAR